tara:strand:+ start:157 stop:882 length:726 start_codon:yes stop_codon:yes gene_type:complete
MLYHVPDVTTKAQLIEKLDPVGLSHAGLNESSSAAGATDGPAGRPGMFAAHTDARLKRIGYYPEKQEWHQCGEFWIGLNGSGVQPHQLMKRDLLAGHMVELGDGNEWLIPAAIRPDTMQPLLPFSYSGENGEWTKAVKEQFQPFWELALEVLEIITVSAEGSEENQEALQKFTDEYRLNAAVLALSINYRISKYECQILELFDDENLNQIMFSIIDWPTVEDAFKKKEPDDSLSTTPGDKD